MLVRKIFGIYFCVIFVHQHQRFISGRETGYQALLPPIFQFFLIFPKFPKIIKVLSCLATRQATLIQCLLYHVSYGEQNLYQNLEMFHNFMSAIVFRDQKIKAKIENSNFKSFDAFLYNSFFIVIFERCFKNLYREIIH